MTYIVYQHTSTVTGKAYIGVTGAGLQHRFEEHVADSVSRVRDRPFLRAIRKHGAAAWRHEVLHEVETFERALELEIEEIAQRSTKAPGGYNVTDGGEGTSGFKHKPEGVAKRSGARHVQAERYVVTFPDGHEEEIHGLTAFCKARGLDVRKAHETTWNSGRRCGGFRFRKLGERPVAAGGRPRGGASRMSPEKRAEIMRLIAEGVKTRELVLRFDVSDVTIGKLRRLVA